MCVDRKEPLPNASLWNRLKLENEMLRSFYSKVVYKIRETWHNGFHEIGLPFCCIQKKKTIEFGQQMRNLYMFQLFSMDRKYKLRR